MSYIWMGRRGRGGQYLAPLVFLARLREGWEKIYDEIGQIGKGPEDSLNLIKIKNPFRYLKTQADAWWVRFFGFKKHVFLVHTSKKASTLLILTTDIIIDHIENTIQGKQISWHEHISYSELVSWCFCQVHLILLISISNLKLYPVLFIFINSIHIHQSIQIHFIHLNPFSLHIHKFDPPLLIFIQYLSFFIRFIHSHLFSSIFIRFYLYDLFDLCSYLFKILFKFQNVHWISFFSSIFILYTQFHPLFHPSLYIINPFHLFLIYFYQFLSIWSISLFFINVFKQKNQFPKFISDFIHFHPLYY